MLTRPRPFGDERGSAVLLVPAGMLVMIILMAFMIDTAMVRSAAHQLDTAVDAAAADTLAALDVDALRRGDGIRLDEDQARAIAAESLRANRPGAQISSVLFSNTADGTIVVTVTASETIDYVIGQALGSRSVTVRRSGEATLLGTAPHS